MVYYHAGRAILAVKRRMHRMHGHFVAVNQIVGGACLMGTGRGVNRISACIGARLLVGRPMHVHEHIAPHAHFAFKRQFARFGVLCELGNIGESQHLYG